MDAGFRRQPHVVDFVPLTKDGASLVRLAHDTPCHRNVVHEHCMQSSDLMIGFIDPYNTLGVFEQAFTGVGLRP
jgi:hypothetical protein